MYIFFLFICWGKPLAFHTAILSDWIIIFLTDIFKFEFVFKFENSCGLLRIQKFKFVSAHAHRFLHMCAVFCAYARASVGSSRVLQLNIIG